MLTSILSALILPVVILSPLIVVFPLVDKSEKVTKPVKLIVSEVIVVVPFFSVKVALAPSTSEDNVIPFTALAAIVAA